MNLPGFTAEASLATTSEGRWIGTAKGQRPSGQGIIPQLYPKPGDTGDTGDAPDCDVYITCVEGIRYSVFDCHDGVERRRPIGTCTEPWWTQPFHYWKMQPWFVRG